MYTPDNWIILRINSGSEIIYKILAGWSGSYLYGSSWKLNSGVTRYEEGGDYILFHSYSGSVYRCHKNQEQLRLNASYVYNEIKTAWAERVNIIEYKDFVKEFTNPESEISPSTPDSPG